MPSAVIAPVVGAVAGSLLSDDSGAEGMNDAAAEASRMQAQIAREQWQNYKDNYQPLEKNVIADAQNYDSQANYEKALGEATGTVADQFGAARARLSRTPGLDPSSAAFTSRMAGLDMAQAASTATAQNKARQGVRDMAWARKIDALGLGKGLPAQASASLGSAAMTSANLGNAAYGRSMNEAYGIGQIASGIYQGGKQQGWWGSNGGLSDASANTGGGYFGGLKMGEV